MQQRGRALGGLVRAAAILVTAAAASAQNAWINEFHYDNQGMDVDEFVEIAGPADLDLSGWSVVGYNAEGGVYKTITLSGLLPDEGICRTAYGALEFSFTRMRNGRGGLALVQPDGTTVVDFLSYEGALTGSSGPAAGLVAEDVGVIESNNTPVGTSIQRVGLASGGAGFGWVGSAPDSRGVINAGQTIAPVAATLTRNAGTNPNCYTAGTFVLGGSVQVSVDLAPSGHTMAILLGFFTPTSITLATGQTLLCIDGGQGEVLTGTGLVLAGQPIATATIPVANSPELCGFSFCTQAILTGAGMPFALSNANDHTVGS